VYKTPNGQNQTRTLGVKLGKMFAVRSTLKGSPMPPPNWFDVAFWFVEGLACGMLFAFFLVGYLKRKPYG
jgi:hypothetical protein